MTDIADFRAYHWARAGIGSPIEKAAVDGVVSWRELEDRYEDELKCESKHSSRDNLACSVTVTHLHKFCGDEAIHVCNNHAASKLRSMADGSLCDFCGEKSRDCWRVVPI